MAPKYAVEKVVAAARSGAVELVGSRARDIVLQYVNGLLEAVMFAQALVGSLRLEHFQETVKLDPPHAGDFDVYICPLEPALIAKHGLEHVKDWYVKLQLIEDENGDSVLVVSMHPPEKPANPRRKK